MFTSLSRIAFPQRKTNRKLISESINAIGGNESFKTPTPLKFENLPLPLYGGKYTATLLPGGKVCSELMKHVKNVLKETMVGLNFEVIPTSTSSIIDKELCRIKCSIRRNRVALKGCIDLNEDDEQRSQFNVSIRTELDLYVSIAHIRPYPNVRSIHRNCDIVLARQNTEGEYFMLEHAPVKGIVEDLKVITKQNTELIARWVFDYAVAHKRKKITIVHKRDVDAITDGLFVATVGEIADGYPLEFEFLHVTTFINRLVTRPDRFDVILLPNLCGCAATYILCGICGGAGLFSKINYGDYFAVFEPAVQKKIERHVENPIALLNAAVDMLKYLKMDKHADMIKFAIHKTICDDRIHTPDLGGKNTTSDVIERIKYYVRNYKET